MPTKIDSSNFFKRNFDFCSVQWLVEKICKVHVKNLRIQRVIGDYKTPIYFWNCNYNLDLWTVLTFSMCSPSILLTIRSRRFHAAYIVLHVSGVIASHSSFRSFQSTAMKVALRLKSPRFKYTDPKKSMRLISGDLRGISLSLTKVIPKFALNSAAYAGVNLVVWDDAEPWWTYTFPSSPE